MRYVNTLYGWGQILSGKNPPKPEMYGMTMSRTGNLLLDRINTQPQQARPPQHQRRSSGELLLDRITRGICESAVRSHRADYERLADRLAAEIKVREMLVDLNNRLAQAKAARGKPGFAITCTELSARTTEAFPAPALHNRTSSIRACA